VALKLKGKLSWRLEKHTLAACSKLGAFDAIFKAEFMASNYQIHSSL
jgi:hypothetical protein